MIRKTMRALRIIPLTALLTSCATMTLDSDAAKTPSSQSGTHTQHGSYYDIVWSEPPADKCGPRQGFARVRYHTNVLYALVSLASLGLYVPQTVEWWCDGKTDDDEEEYIPPNAPQ